MKKCSDVLCHSYVHPVCSYWILPQIRPDLDPNRIQIHWIRLDPDPTQIHQIHWISSSGFRLGPGGTGLQILPRSPNF